MYIPYRWTPKYQYRILEGLVKELLSKDIQILLEWKSCELIEMNVQIDHIHLIASIPPKISISELMGILKEKTAIKIFKSYPQLKKKPYWGNHLWARGYCADTIGLDEDKIKKYVKYQEEQERIEEQQRLEFGPI
jgi:putative transposase